MLHCLEVDSTSLLPNSATYTHQQGPTNICSLIHALASMDNELPEDSVTAPKHVRAILM